jgi:hypothetical protein
VVLPEAGREAAEAIFFGEAVFDFNVDVVVVWHATSPKPKPGRTIGGSCPKSKCEKHTGLCRLTAVAEREIEDQDLLENGTGPVGRKLRLLTC